MKDLPANQARAWLSIDHVYSELGVLTVEGNESLGNHFEFRVRFAASNQLTTSNLIQTFAQLSFVDRHHKRSVYGVIESIQLTEQHPGYGLYLLHLVPEIKRLEHRTRYRIFQHKTAKEIVQHVMRDAKLYNLRQSFELTKSYPTLEYVVQYGESDWQFIKRLLSEQGMHFHHRHHHEGATFVIADDPSSFDAFNAKLPFKSATGNRTDRESIYQLGFNHNIGSNQSTNKGYHYQQPKLDIYAQSANTDPRQQALEIFDYQGGVFHSNAEAERVAVEAQRAIRTLLETAVGQTDSVMLQPGYRLRITDHPDPLVNETLWLILSVDHSLKQPGALAAFNPASVSDYSGHNDSDNGYAYHCDFQLTDAIKLWRLPRIGRPKIGNDTAVVVGPVGEEIYSDELGRVKVHFHWDREGIEDGDDSCWLRVLQPAAGAGFGTQYIPRIGDEVLIGYFQGDPNRPFVRASLYNADNATPWILPKHKVRLGLKTASYPGKNKHHEWRLDDTKGNEQWLLKSSRDLDVLINNDEREHLFGHAHQLVDGDQFLTHQGEVHRQIGKNSFEQTGIDQHVKISGDLIKQVGSTLAQQASEIVLSSDQQFIIEANNQLTLKAGSSTLILGPQGITIDGPSVYYNSGGVSKESAPAVPDAAIDALEADCDNQGWLNRP